MALVALFAGGIAYENSHQSVPALSGANRVPLEAGNQAPLFEIYREAVNAYASSHPGFSGTVPVGDLVLPAGMVVPPGFSNTVSGGTAYAWVPPGSTAVSPNAILGSLTRVSVGSMLVGMNRRGVLFSPILGSTGSTGISLPSSIPNGSVVSLSETVGPGQTFGGTPAWPQEQSSSSSTSSYDGTTQRVCLSYRSYPCDRCRQSGHHRYCWRTTCSYCSNWQTQYQWASYACTNYDWIFQPGGTPSDPTSSCTRTGTWWENSP